MLWRRLLAEFVGTCFFVIAVIGSGIAASRLSPSDHGLALFENAAATGAALVAIILALGPVSGAHLNPVITLVDRAFGKMTTKEAVGYAVGQFAGGLSGAAIANLMYSLPAISISHHHRSGGGVWLAEVVATFGLVLIVFAVTRSGRSGAAPFAVGSYIAAAYFFTSSTSFANPAVTVARTLSNTFAGIAPWSVIAFCLAQVIGGLFAYVVVRALIPG